MRHVLALALVAGLGLGLAGCSDTSKVEETHKVEGPGGTVEVKDTKEVKESGNNPPPAATTEPPPAK